MYAEDAPVDEAADPAKVEESKKEGVKAAPSVQATVAKDKDEGGDDGKSDRRAGLAKLLKKFSRPDGSSAPIAVLTPLDYTTLNYTEAAQETIMSTLNRYGKVDVRVIDYSPPALNLEEFRKVVTRFDVDIVVLSVLKPTNFDIFLYDRRTPYNIYAHSETLPEAIQYQLTKEAVEEYTKVIMRRALFAYMQDQFYELPREESRPFLNAEIPRFIASARSFQTINREILSNYYLSLATGATLAAGGPGLWTSNLVSLEFGARVFSSYFAELNVDLFSYNAVGAQLKYMFANRESPFRFSVGGGVAMLMNQHTLNYDQKHTQGEGGNYIVTSGTLVFPVVELHVKVEGKMFVSLDGSKFILALLPGFYFMF